MKDLRWLVPGFVLGLLVALAPSCGPLTKCSDSSCPGCCDSAGVCQSGTSDAACGSFAAQCSACTGVLVCSAGQCVPTGGGNVDGGQDAGTDAGPTDGGPGDAGVDAGTFEFNDAGCLTYAGASELCGFNSSGAICTYSVGCGTSSDVGQCKINCEMGTTVTCYHPSDVSCLQSAVATQSCSALTSCGFIL